MPWPGSPIFFSQKFDLINLLPRLGHSSLLNVSCAQILPRLGHSSLLNVSCAQILHKLSKTAQTSNTAAIEQRTRGAENTKRHKRATRHNWATRHKLSNTGAIEQRTRGAENARFSGLWRLRSNVTVTVGICLRWSQGPTFEVLSKSSQRQLRYGWHWVCVGGGD